MTANPSTVHQDLLARIERCQALVAVIGLGYVGLPLAHALHAGGHRVMGFDIDPEKPRAIAQGRNYLQHLGDTMVTDLRDSARFEATTDFTRLGECDVIIVAVPTPLGKHHEPDISYILTTAEAIGRTLRRGQLIILESTTYPGTTRGDMMPSVLRAAGEKGKGLRLGVDVFAAFSPEREDPGRKSHNTRTIPKLCGGLDAASTELACAVYRKGIAEVVPVSSAEVAEAAKILENTFRAVNIALVNELKAILEPMKIDVWEVIRAAATKPFGYMPFFPGPGLGGHCIPIDPFYLTWKAREHGVFTRFIELAGEINTHMPHHVVDRVAEHLNEHGKPVKGSRVLVLGLAYKADIDDVRESPSFELIYLLLDRGAKVDYSDPHCPQTKAGRSFDLHMKSVSLTPETLAQYDLVLVSTAHSAFDWAMIAANSRLIVDTRDALRKWHGELGSRLKMA